MKIDMERTLVLGCHTSRWLQGAPVLIGLLGAWLAKSLLSSAPFLVGVFGMILAIPLAWFPVSPIFMTIIRIDESKLRVWKFGLLFGSDYIALDRIKAASTFEPLPSAWWSPALKIDMVDGRSVVLGPWGRSLFRKGTDGRIEDLCRRLGGET